MPNANWSFPCSPRNPAKVREELRLLAALAASWRLRGMPWSPRSGAQLEFGRELRLSAGSGSPKSEVRGRADDFGLRTSDFGLAASQGDDPSELRFQRQAEALSDDNLRWTARARWGTYKFFGFVTLDAGGCATLTPAGERFVDSSRPGEVLLRQLLKWQYPDGQHRGSRWPAEEFAIHPFVATARLIRELGGLTKREIALFCFTMRRTEEAAATGEAIRQFRARSERAAGRTGKARAAHGAREAARHRFSVEGRRIALRSMGDYADALVRYLRYTGLFSVRGARIVVASGREVELEELIYQDLTPWPPSRDEKGERLGSAFSAQRLSIVPPSSREGGQGVRSPDPVQLAFGQAPPVRLAAPWPLFPDYADVDAFYAYYGSASQPRLPWEESDRLAAVARALREQVAALQARAAHLRSGRTVLAGPDLGSALPGDYDPLVDLVERLRHRKRRLEETIYAVESRSPERVREALDFYDAILSREVIDPPTFLEWNTWRAFLALDQAREIVPHLALDDDLQPLNTAQGNQADMEIDYGDFALVVEVTLRTGADQRQAEARPVTRHILEAMRKRVGQSEVRSLKTPDRLRTSDFESRTSVYGLFVAPKIHQDTATDFFVALKFRVIERQQVVAIPLSVRQLVAALRSFAGHVPFAPELLRRLLDACVAAALSADTGEEWLAGIDAALRHWLAALGAPPPPAERTPAALPLPLFV